MPVKQVDCVGEYITLREAARRKGSTPNAVYLWLRGRQVPLVKFGQTLLTRQADIVGYTHRGR